MSNSSGRSLPKPLIDIKSLSNSPLSNTPAVSSSNSSPPVQLATPTNPRNDTRLPTNINERLLNLAQGLTRPKPASSVVPESTVKTDSEKIPPAITGRTPPSRSTTAPAEVLPQVEERPASLDKASRSLDLEISLAPQTVRTPTPETIAASPSVNTTEFPIFTSPRTSLSLDDPTPIKPTPIHHRIPQSGFSVMSRPHHNSTRSTSVSTIFSMNSAQKLSEKEGEPLDSIGDFTAAMFSQLDLGFSNDEARESLDSTIKQGVTTTVTTKVTTPSPAATSNPASPAPGPTTQIANPTGKAWKKETTAPARPAPSDTPSPRQHTFAPESTVPRRSLRRPRSVTLVTPSRTPQPPDDQPQPRPTPRTQPPRSVKSTPDVSGSRKATVTPKVQTPPPMSRHKRVPSTVSTSSESSSESSSSAPSIAPSRKQKQPQTQSRPQQSQPQPRPQQSQPQPRSQQSQPQPRPQQPQSQPRPQQSQPQARPQQPTSRTRSATLSTLITAIPPSPTNSSNNSPSPALNRPPQRPFAMRDNSPSSSTGDSSSGRLPITPRDGSEIGSELGRGIRGKRQMLRATESLGVGSDGLLSASNSEMGLKAKKLAHRKSASYDDSTLKAAMKAGGGMPTTTDEARRRERRRSEAKNAIEVEP